MDSIDNSAVSRDAAHPSGTGEEQVATRRGFLKMAAVGATATAAAPLLGGQAAAQDANADSTITIPQQIADRANYALPDIDFPMSGANLFARACQAEGVAALFCCPGNYEVIHAVNNIGIPSYSGRHEGNMASAADAFIRATGEVAVCSGTEGPGFTLMVGPLTAAYFSSTPMLLVASNKRFDQEDTQAGIQLMYQQPMTEGVKKYGKRLTQPARLSEYIGYAFRNLKSGVPGPVHLDFPAEVSRHEYTDETELGYYGNNATPRYRSDSRPAASNADLERAADMLRQAERPMIVASTGVFYSKAWDALRALAEKTQIPVAESGPMRGHFADSHPLSASAAPDALSSADVVMLVGQYCMPTIGEFAFGPDTRYIRIQPSDCEDIGRNLPVDVGVVACEKLALEALADLMPSMNHESWVAEVAAARQAFQDQNEEYYRLGLSYTDAVHPAVIARELADFLYNGDLPPDQTTVVSGGFGIARYTRRYLQAHRPGQIVNGAYQFAAIGPDVAYAVGAAAAMQTGAGVQAAYRGSPIINITGDAGFGYTGMELETLAKYRLPAVNIVYNNNSWGTWYGRRDVEAQEHLHLFQENLRYDRIAEALGGHGEYVTTPDQFLPALQRAYDIAAREGIPSVINCQAKKEFWLPAEYQPGFLGKAEPGVMAYYH